MKLLKVDQVEEAKDKFFKHLINNDLKIEKINLLQSLNRIISEDIYSKEDVPHFNRSTVDGYAVISKDTYGASESLPTFLKVISEVEMGEECTVTLKNGECVYVPTGGMIPLNSDAVIMIEYCETFGTDEVAIYSSVSSKQGVTFKQEDCAKDQLLFKKGHLVKPHDIGVLASIGIMEIKVYSKIKATIISSGDELVDPLQKPKLGQIRDINTYVLEASTKDIFDIVRKEVVKDDENQIKEILNKAKNDSEIILISGGSSQGQKDLSAKLLDELGNPGVFTHGIAMKPGKPTILGFSNNIALVGLPGHPVAALLVLKTIVLPCYYKKMGFKNEIQIKAILKENVMGGNGRQVCQLVKLEIKDSEYYAYPIHGKSGLMTTLTKADGYIEIDSLNEGYAVNSNVLVTLL